MRYGIKIATVVLLLISLGLAYVGYTGLQTRNEWKELKDDDYSEYQANIAEYTEKAAACKSIAEQSLNNIDGYIAQMKADRIALYQLLDPAWTAPEPVAETPAPAAEAPAPVENASDEPGSSESVVIATQFTLAYDAFKAEEEAQPWAQDERFKDINKAIDNAMKTRDAAVNELINEKKGILFRYRTVLDLAGKPAEDAAAIKKANNDLFKIFNLARTALGKITQIKDKDTQNAEYKVAKEYQKAVTAVSKLAAAEGVEPALTEYVPEVDSYAIYLDQIGSFADKQKDESELDEEAQRIAARKAQIRELESGWSGFLIGNWDYFFWFAGLFLIASVLCLIGWLNPTLLKQIASAANKKMMLVALVVITLFFFVATRYKNLSPENITNIINQCSYIVILATGMLLCIICSANIDLSVGRVMGFIAACAVIFVQDLKIPAAVTLPLCLLIGVAIGAWQGFWIAYMKIPAFVVTLAGQLTFYGLTMVLLHGETRAPFPKEISNLFGGSLLSDIPGGKSVALWVGIVLVVAFIGLQIYRWNLRKRKAGSAEPLARMLIKTLVISGILIWVFYSLSVDRGLPMVLITVSLVLLVYTFLTTKTVPGRHLYAMGGNVNAARLSGVKTQRMLFLAYVNMGFLAALAGLVYAVRMNSAFPMAGQGDELNAIAACYIGGASAYGGIGTVGGAVIGAMTMGVIKNGMSMVGMNQDIQQVVLGLVLLIAVVIDVVSKSNGAPLPFLSRLTMRREKKDAPPPAAHKEPVQEHK